MTDQTNAREVERFLLWKMQQTKPGTKEGIEAACRVQGAQTVILAMNDSKFWRALRKERLAREKT